MAAMHAGRTSAVVQYVDLKQFSVWLINARPPMLVEANATDQVRSRVHVQGSHVRSASPAQSGPHDTVLVVQGFEAKDTWFSIAIKIVKAHLKSYIISSSADQAAVILYGTVRYPRSHSST